MLGFSNAQAIITQLKILEISLMLRAFVKPEEEPWNNYELKDYASDDEYCRSCLLDKNGSGDGKLFQNCWIPVISPTGQTVNINALLTAQKNLTSSKNPLLLHDDLKKELAQKLISVMQYYEMEPSRKLLKLAE